MTMLKLSSRSSTRRRLANISPTAFLLLRGVSGRDLATSNTPVDWAKFADEIGDRIAPKVEHTSVATLTANTVPKEQASITQRSLTTTITYVGNNGSPAAGFPLGECEGDCDENLDCAGDLICYQRNANEAVPGCDGGQDESTGTDYCIRPTATIVTTTSGSPTPIPAPTSPRPSPLPTPIPTKNPSGYLTTTIKYVGNNGSPAAGFPLGECEGDCDENLDCAGDLICYQRNANEAVPGCDGGQDESTGTDYCIRPTATIVTTTSGSPTPIPAPTSPRPSPLPTPIPTKNPSGYLNYMHVERTKNLKECEGDCDSNNDCVGNLVCYQRQSGGDPLPGCEGTPNSGTDFCIRPEFTPEPTKKPTRRPTPRPTRKPTRTPTMAPTFAPFPGGEPAAMIKMYWQRGYFWQERTTEEWYCLQCRNAAWDGRKGCQVGMKIEIDDCNRGRDRQQFVRVEGDKTIRPAMSPDLCISHQNHADYAETDTLTVEYCNGGIQQQFDIVGTPWQKNGKFEIRTSLTSNREPTCLTNAHHPRREEDIFPQWCARARRHETASWTAY